MERRKAGYILLLIFMIPVLSIPVAAATNPIQNFSNNLLLIIPPLLFVLSLIALRGADYDYAFTLLLAAVIVTVALASFQARVNSFSLLFYNLQVTMVGPSTTTVNSPVSYSVTVSPLPQGWNVQKVEYVWLVYYNSSILAYNSSSGYVSNYVSNVASSQKSLSFTPTQTGEYLVSYSISYFANVSGYPGVAIGGSGGLLQVEPPSSLLSWIAGAIVSAVSSLVASTLGTITSALSLIAQPIFDAISYALIMPTVSGNLGNVVENIYNELIQISLTLSLLFIAATVAYNALRSNYTDLIDVASDLFYKIIVWLFFTFGGLEIYNYAATFINSLIYEIINPYLPVLGADIVSATDLFLGLFAVDNVIGFGFARSLGIVAGDLVKALIFFALFIGIRYFLILAIVALTPLLATFWLFEWTRRIGDILVDVLIGLALAGLLNTIIIALVIASGVIWLLIFLPFIADLGTIISLSVSLVAIKPHESLSFSPRKGNTKLQSTQTPQTPPPPTTQQPPPQKPTPLTYI